MAQTNKQPARKAPPRTVKATGRGVSPEAESLLALIDKLGALLEKSELAELEVEAGETGIVLRKPSAAAPSDATSAVQDPGPATAGLVTPAPAAAVEPAAPESSVKTVRAPLTGVFYEASSPTAPPYVAVGQQVVVGQIIGLIEAMKLFNEIKSDVSGKVVRIVAESGKLVKAKQPLIEVEP
jgi:acetyl-CoA carboxylase biotin carboxyl carrier protein